MLAEAAEHSDDENGRWLGTREKQPSAAGNEYRHQ